MKLKSLLFGSLLVLGASASTGLNRTLGMGISNECGPLSPNSPVCDQRVPCCSKWNYCGTDEQYCGAGCQPQYSFGGVCPGQPPSCAGAQVCPQNAPCCNANTRLCFNDAASCQQPTCLPGNSFGASCAAQGFCGENPQTLFDYTCPNIVGQQCCTNNVCGNDCVNCDPIFSYPGTCVIPDDCGPGAAGASCTDPNLPCCVNGHCTGGVNQCISPTCDQQYSLIVNQVNSCVGQGFCGTNAVTGFQYQCGDPNDPCCIGNTCGTDCGVNCDPFFSYEGTCAIPSNPCPSDFPCYNRNTGQCGSSSTDCNEGNCDRSRSFSLNGQSACNPYGFCGTNPATNIDYSCEQPGNPCCSSNGYCGSSAAYCGAGCQSFYSLGNPCFQPQPNPPVCGAGAGGASCPIGQCCNSVGQCGTGNSFCGAGCQAAYSNFYCQQCGAGIGSCPTPGNPGAVCCSGYNFCGSGAAYCQIKPPGQFGCQQQFSAPNACTP